MTEFPFQLLIKRISGERKAEYLTCRSILRAVPGNREVYDAVWHNRAVIAKVFARGFSGRRHLNCEWRGLTELRERGLNCPKHLFYGKLEDGRWVVVQEKILEAVTVLDIFNNTTAKAERFNLLIAVSREMAKQHERGVLQKDFHLDNFMLKKGEIFTIDPAQIYFSSSDIWKKKSLFQLATLANTLQEDYSDYIQKLYEEYFSVREWDFNKSDLIMLEKLRFQQRKLSVRKELKKCLRTSKRHARIKFNEYLASFEKDFCREDEAAGFIERLDLLMEGGQILKNGNTCYVSRVCWNGKDVVIKRYNDKGFIYSVLNTIVRSRARRGWLHGHRFEVLGIPTARPVAFIECRDGIFVRKSYLVAEFVEGKSLDGFLRGNGCSEQQKTKIGSQLAAVFNKLDKYRIIHGDLKYSNILLTDKGPKLIDLDAVTVPVFGWWYKIRRAKALKHFSDCGKNYPDFISSVTGFLCEGS